MEKSIAAAAPLDFLTRSGKEAGGTGSFFLNSHLFVGVDRIESLAQLKQLSVRTYKTIWCKRAAIITAVRTVIASCNLVNRSRRSLVLLCEFGSLFRLSFPPKKAEENLGPLWTRSCHFDVPAFLIHAGWNYRSNNILSSDFWPCSGIISRPAIARAPSSLWPSRRRRRRETERDKRLKRERVREHSPAPLSLLSPSFPRVSRGFYVLASLANFTSGEREGRTEQGVI